ncbi:MAG: hypothetical protein FWF97_01735 [Alphaproteobacteria bacterium]|nr:hypothetical protein [Alphaproteobacteria bacterium]
MKKLLITLTLCTIHYTIYASDCLQFKVSPEVKITTTEWTRDVVQPPAPMDKFHGTVTASFDEEFRLRVAAQPAGEGYCIVLGKLDATVGYTNFLVHIDGSHIPGSCEYHMVLNHETEHIAAHIAALEGESENIKAAIRTAANSVMPVFVKSLDGVNAALDRMQDELQSHPDIVLMKQKLTAEQEIRNKKVDERDDGKRINMCK